MFVRSRGMALAALLALLCAAGAVGCWHEAREASTDAAWLMIRERAQAVAYARTFDGKMADQQLATMSQHRAAFDRTENWRLGQMLCVMGAVFFAIAAYVFFLFRRLREQLADALPEESPAASAALANAARIR